MADELARFAVTHLPSLPRPAPQSLASPQSRPGLPPAPGPGRGPAPGRAAATGTAAARGTSQRGSRRLPAGPGHLAGCPGHADRSLSANTAMAPLPRSEPGLISGPPITAGLSEILSLQLTNHATPSVGHGRPTDRPAQAGEAAEGRPGRSRPRGSVAPRNSPAARRRARRICSRAPSSSGAGRHIAAQVRGVSLMPRISGACGRITAPRSAARSPRPPAAPARAGGRNAPSAPMPAVSPVAIFRPGSPANWAQGKQ